MDRWVVVVSGADMNEELCKVLDTHASFQAAADDFIQMKYTVAPEIGDHPIEAFVISGPLTCRLSLIFPDVVDEIRTAFPEIMPSPPLPGGRNGDYLKTIVEFAFSVAKSSTILSLVPGVFKPDHRYFVVKLMIPLIQERLAKLQGADNDQFDKSYDYLTWLIEEAQKSKSNPNLVLEAILV
ncbi:predicted protein [Postia placenta Mad-698-R]|nr:predicted protein [Postia placenta Mad-698-R]